MSGKTIRIADKGLNCAENIIHALKDGDGYIFSKSVKLLPCKEQTWVLLENGCQDVRNRKGQETESKIKVTLNEKAIRKALSLAGYNLLVTPEVKTPASEIYSIYHNSLRIGFFVHSHWLFPSVFLDFLQQLL